MCLSRNVLSGIFGVFLLSSCIFYQVVFKKKQYFSIEVLVIMHLVVTIIWDMHLFSWLCHCVVKLFKFFGVNFALPKIEHVLIQCLNCRNIGQLFLVWLWLIFARKMLFYLISCVSAFRYNFFQLHVQFFWRVKISYCRLLFRGFPIYILLSC